MDEEEKKKIVDILKNDINLNRVFNWIQCSKNHFKKRNDRHLGSEIRESFFVSENVKYIDEEGADLLHKTIGKMEVKSSFKDGYLFTKLANPRKKVKTIILKNTNSKKIIEAYTNKSILIICCERHCISVVFFEDLIKNKLIDTTKPGQVLAKNIPESLFYKLITHEQFISYVNEFDGEQKLIDFKKNLKDDFESQYEESKKNNDLTQPEEKNKMNTPIEKKDYTLKKSDELYFLLIERDIHKRDVDKLYIKDIAKIFKTKEKPCYNYIKELENSNKITCKEKDRLGRKRFEINKEHPVYSKYLEYKENESIESSENNQLELFEDENYSDCKVDNIDKKLSNNTAIIKSKDKKPVGVDDDFFSKVWDSKEISREMKIKITNSVL
jgi:hypothetical protein